LLAGAIGVAAGLMLTLQGVSAQAASENAAVGFGSLYYDGAVVGVIATPTSQPGAGVDPIYAFPGDKADGQFSITASAPGDRDYHGGRWAVHLVTWNVEPYLITSDADLLAARDAGDVSITRAPQADFVCPVLP
jgi:hypothetical protein